MIDLSLHVRDDVTQLVNVVHELISVFCSTASYRWSSTSATWPWFYQLRRLKQVRRVLGPEISANLVSAFVASRLDYCNSLLAGLPKYTIDPLQRAQNAAARLFTGLRSRGRLAPSLQQLHWVHAKCRIIYKLCVLVHKVHTGRSSVDLTNLVTASANLPSRKQRLRSVGSRRYDVPRAAVKVCEQTVSFSGASTCNNLTKELQVVDDPVV